MSHTAYRILVVDDDTSILFLLRKMLEKEQHVPLCAESAFQALSILEREPVDMILSDIAMPKMDGLEFLRRVKHIKPHVPVVIMTADPNLPRVKLALQDGALDFLEKPFDLDRIFQSIHRYASIRLTSRVISLQDRSILLVSTSEKKQPQLTRSLLSTRGTVTTMRDPEEALQFAQNGPVDLVVYAMGNAVPNPNFFTQIATLHPAAKTIFVAEQYDGNQMNSLIGAAHVDSIVFKNKNFSEADLAIAVRKLFSQDIFGIEKYMCWGFEPIQHTTQHTDDRFKFIEIMSEYLRTLKISGRFISRMENVADEFLSNALYNAPVDEAGRSLYRETERTKGRACTEREKCLLSYVYDGRYFGLAIQDNFGSLTKEQVFRGIKRCLDEEGAPARKRGGAGLGLYLSFLTLNKFIINIQPGVRTEMIGLCNVRSSMKDFDLLDKSLSIFVEP